MLSDWSWHCFLSATSLMSCVIFNKECCEQRGPRQKPRSRGNQPIIFGLQAFLSFVLTADYLLLQRQHGQSGLHCNFCVSISSYMTRDNDTDSVFHYSTCWLEVKPYEAFMLSLEFYGSMPLLVFLPLDFLHLSVKVKVSSGDNDWMHSMWSVLTTTGIYTTE